MKKALISSLVAGLLAGGMTTANAQDVEFSGNVAFTTDYVWRGVSQSDNDLAVQGGFDLAAGMFYAGTWGSAVDFGGPETMEWDLYGGVAGEFGDSGVGWDVGYIAYLYPGDSDINFGEGYVGLTYKWFGAYWYEQLDDPTGGDGASYVSLSADFELPNDFGIGVSYGMYNFDQAGADDYNDYKVGVTKSFGGFDFELAYTDTSSVDPANSSRLNDGQIWFMVGKSF
ncbi:MAG: TorF family putative porin [Gammaproteobacteria bacterium]